MINLEPLGSNILAIFFAMAYLAGKMSTIVNLMAAAQHCKHLYIYEFFLLSSANPFYPPLEETRGGYPFKLPEFRLHDGWPSCSKVDQRHAGVHGSHQRRSQLLRR